MQGIGDVHARTLDSMPSTKNRKEPLIFGTLYRSALGGKQMWRCKREKPRAKESSGLGCCFWRGGHTDVARSDLCLPVLTALYNLLGFSSNWIWQRWKDIAFGVWRYSIITPILLVDRNNVFSGLNEMSCPTESPMC